MLRSRSRGFAFCPRDLELLVQFRSSLYILFRTMHCRNNAPVAETISTVASLSVSLRLFPLQGFDSPRRQTPPPVIRDGTRKPDLEKSPFRYRSGFSLHLFLRPPELIGNRVQTLFTIRQDSFSPFVQTTVTLSVSDNI